MSESKKVLYPRCPYCNLSIEKYNEKTLLQLVSNEDLKNIIIQCPNCNSKVKITCQVSFDGWVIG